MAAVYAARSAQLPQARGRRGGDGSAAGHGVPPTSCASPAPPRPPRIFLSLAPPEHHHARDRARPPYVVRQPELRVLHLALAGLAAKLRHALRDHAHAARADRMPERLEAPARVDREAAVERRLALLLEPPTLTFLAEPQVLDVRDLGPGEAVVHLGEVDVAWRDASHRVRLLRRRLRRTEAQVVEGRVEVWTSARHREARALHQHRGVLETLRQVGAADDGRRRAVGGGTAVEEAERPGDDRRLQHLLLGHLHPEMRLRVLGAVPVILDGDLGERLATEAEGM